MDDPAATAEDASLWPVFVIVVGDRPATGAASVAPLFELLERPRHESELAVVSARCRWSVVDARNALLRLAIDGDAPVRFAAEIILPARQVLGILDVVARGATIGITTSRYAGRLSGRGVDIRRALNGLVLLTCPSSSELAVLADMMSVIDVAERP